MKNKTFTESQSFVSMWLSVLMLLPIALSAFFFFNSDSSEFGIGLVVGLVVGITVVFGILFGVRLRTHIDDEGIHVDFKPFVWNKIWRWEEIENITVKKYSLWDYGGWGYRIGKDGMAYTTKGRYGFQVEFKNGKKILIGTQHPHEVQEFLQNSIRHGNV